MKLSIITINFNNREGLIKTADSVMSQTFRDFEWILIDGGSSDGSADVIADFANKTEANISYWCSEPDKGIYNAMNKGILHAHGEYCLFLNSGDYLIDNIVLATVFSVNREENLLWGTVKYCAKDEKPVIFGLQTEYFSAFELCRYCIPHQGCFINRVALLEANGYDESYQIGADLKFFFYSIYIKKCSKVFLNMIISVMDGNGVSSDENKCRLDEYKVLNELGYSCVVPDYQRWISLIHENEKLKSSLCYYRNAIVIYDKIKKYPLIRKIHTLVYNLIK